MFGFKKKKALPVGAKAKVQAAQDLRRQGGDDVKSGHKGKGQDDTVPVVIAIYGLACALSLLLMQFTWPQGPSFHLPDPVLDRMVLKMPPPPMVGDKDMDVIAAMFMRGLVFFFLAGITPGLTKLIALVFRRGKKNAPIWMFWMVLSFLLTGAAILGKM
jgi:hypothetical protein